MAELLMSEFNGFEGDCVLEEVDNVDVMNEVENVKNIGEKFRGEECKRKRPEYQSQAGSKKMKTEEEDPEITCIDVLPNELLQLILSNLETKDVMAAGQTCRRWFSVVDHICQQKAEEIEASWKMTDHVPTPAEVMSAVLLESRGNLLRQVITIKAEEIEASWTIDDYFPSPAEVHCASSFVANGLLPHQVITNKADKIAEYMEDADIEDNLSLAEVQCGAALATQGYITQLENLWLYDIDTSLVPASDLSSLVKCVSDGVSITSVTGDLSSLLSSVQFRGLLITNTSLSTADTQRLVAAMVTRVEWVTLDGGVTLDMDTLAQYDGLGKCEEVRFWSDTTERYRDQLKVWASNMGWQIEEISVNISMKRK